MNVYYDDEEDLKAKLAEAVYLLYYLRKHTKIWGDVFGFPAKKQKQIWEDKSDDFLKRLMKESKELYANEKINIVEK